MQFRTLLTALTLAALSMTARAAEPAAPAVHQAPSAQHGTGKGATPHVGAAAVSPVAAPKPISPIGGHVKHDVRQGGDKTPYGSSPAGGGVSRQGTLSPAGPLGSHASGSGAVPTVVRSTAQINGTGMAHKSIGPASVGAGTKPRNGINGTGIRIR
jgi:hypothetical protein